MRVPALLTLQELSNSLANRLDVLFAVWCRVLPAILSPILLSANVKSFFCNTHKGFFFFFFLYFFFFGEERRSRPPMMARGCEEYADYSLNVTSDKIWQALVHVFDRLITRGCKKMRNVHLSGKRCPKTTWSGPGDAGLMTCDSIGRPGYDPPSLGHDMSRTNFCFSSVREFVALAANQIH